MADQFSLALVYQWLDTVIASLDCYTWVFSQGFLNPSPPPRQPPAEPFDRLADVFRLEDIHEYPS